MDFKGTFRGDQPNLDIAAGWDCFNSAHSEGSEGCIVPMNLPVRGLIDKLWLLVPLRLRERMARRDG